MSSIDPTSKLLAHIRAEALTWRRDMSAPTGRNPSASSALNTPRNTDDLLARVAQAVVAIDPDDPSRKRKAFRIYLGSVLANELGLHVLNDPGFDDLIGRAQDSMEQNAQLHAAMERAGALLLETAKAIPPRR
ncbi:hypothetical protein [Ralstonia pseudosolanacearum]|uniref:Uncharacterized protein n=1 Tax=Ralstonia solanacearum TaxID=305 RepID=A0AA92IEB5_RALSL|nr:hypothetical protein [Ralstonia pseudosolanacearum]QCX49354.1 hypothetical protein E7Z57_09700 [Ralstonia pseudosolanacearum]